MRQNKQTNLSQKQEKDSLQAAWIKTIKSQSPHQKLMHLMKINQSKPKVHMKTKPVLKVMDCSKDQSLLRESMNSKNKTLKIHKISSWNLIKTKSPIKINNKTSPRESISSKTMKRKNLPKNKNMTPEKPSNNKKSNSNNKKRKNFKHKSKPLKKIPRHHQILALRKNPKRKPTKLVRKLRESLKKSHKGGKHKAQENQVSRRRWRR